MKTFHPVIRLLILSAGLIPCFLACEKVEVHRVVKIETQSVSDFKSNSEAEVLGEIYDLDDDGIIQHGHCWSTTEIPTIEDSITRLGKVSTRGAFTSSMSGLTPFTTYYIRAYATDAGGTTYGNQVSFKKSMFTDSRDDHEYKWVSIGNQVWMAENLAYLPAVSPPTSGSYTEPLYYVFGYDGTSVSEAKDSANYKTYGVLYNWPAAMNGSAGTYANPSGVKGICPDGWHLPSDPEWQQLIDFVSSDGHEGTEAMALKASEGWENSGNGTDDYGFSALPGGIREDGGYFDDMPFYGKWWSATEDSEENAWKRYMSSDSEEVTTESDYKVFGLSIRCVRDN
jgi:uncharacterized protein (TIGR02145 family)